MTARSRSRRCEVWWALFILAFSSSSAAAAQHRHVLLLHSLEREFAPFNDIEESLRNELSRQSPEPIDFWEISLQPNRRNRRPSEEAILDYLQSAFGDQPPDLIVPIG